MRTPGYSSILATGLVLLMASCQSAKTASGDGPKNGNDKTEASLPLTDQERSILLSVSGEDLQTLVVTVADVFGARNTNGRLEDVRGFETVLDNELLISCGGVCLISEKPRGSQ